MLLTFCTFVIVLLSWCVSSIWGILNLPIILKDCMKTGLYCTASDSYSYSILKLNISLKTLLTSSSNWENDCTRELKVITLLLNLKSKIVLLAFKWKFQSSFLNYTELSLISFKKRSLCKLLSDFSIFKTTKCIHKSFIKNSSFP